MKKNAVLIFGRFNPPTKGHEKLFRTAMKMGERTDADTIVFLSNTQDEKNPLTRQEKARYISLSIPELVIGPAEVRNPAVMLTWAKQTGYQRVIMLAGDDRLEGYNRLVASWGRNETPPKMPVKVVALSRIGHMDAVRVSGTAARAMARRGDVAGLQNILISGAATPAIAGEIVKKLQTRLGVQERANMVIKGFRSWLLSEAEGDPPPGTKMKNQDRDPKDTKLPDEPPKEGEQNPPSPPTGPPPAPKPKPPIPPYPVDATEDDGRVGSDRPENQAKLVIHPPVRMKTGMINKLKMIQQQNATY